MQGPLIRRKRQRPIRVLLAAIFIVPLASLIGLWAFAASVTVTSAIREHNFKTENTLYGGSAQGLGVQLGQERLIAYEYLSSGRRIPVQALQQQFAKTAKTVTDLMQGVKSGPGLFQPSTWPSLTAWENELHGPLNSLRAKVEAGTISPLGAFDAYSRIIDGQFAVYADLIAIDNSGLYRQAAASIEAGRALEMAQRETALITGALAARGQMPKAAKLEFASDVSNKKMLMSDALGNLTPALGSGYQAILSSAPYKAFESIENTIINSIGVNGPIRVTPKEFGAAATPLFADYVKAEMQDRLALTNEGTRVGNTLLLEVALAGGAGLLAVMLSILLMVRFGRRISRELRGLQNAALQLAGERLPHVVQRLSKGEDVDVAAEAAPIPAGRILETARVAEAFASVQHTAVEAAVGQARLRRGVAQVFRNLAWRSQSLLHRQLALLDTMERRQTEPETLDELFQLDHLTTRMRRHAEGLIILSGSSPGRGWREPVPILDVLRAAIAEVEDYKRVTVISDSQDAVAGSAVADVIHLMAELIENATTYSPATTEVTVRAERVANGFAAEVEDRGIGISPEDIAAYNENLSNPPEFDLADSNQLGLFVVARLAAKHNIAVTLRRSPFGGTSAIVLLPNAIVATAERAATFAEVDGVRGELPASGPPELPGSFPGLSLVGSEPSGSEGPTTDGVIPGGAIPIGASPGGADPGGVLPGGVLPSGASPSDASPSGASPSGASPSGAVPIGASPSGSFPAGAGWEGLQSRDSGPAPVIGPPRTGPAPTEPAPPGEPLTGVPAGAPPWPMPAPQPVTVVPTGSPPWPPAEPVVGHDDRAGGRNTSPWFQQRRQVIPGTAQVSDGPAPPLPHRRAPYAQPQVVQPSSAQPQPGQPQAVPRQAVPPQAVPPQTVPSQAGPPQAVPPQTVQRPSIWDTRPPTVPMPAVPLQGAPMPGAAMPAPTVADATKQALPRRQRQASLAPQLREGGPAPIEDGPDGMAGPNPDGSRALVESLQYGLDLADATPASPDESWPGGGNAWPNEPWKPTDAWPSGSWQAPRAPDHATPAEDAEGQ